MNELRQKIWALYESLGVPRKVIGGWALPETDTSDLLQVLREKKPRNVLEIGSYVGISTNMMASLLSEDAQLHAIDPNQPLCLEDGAMGQTEFNSNVRPFELARLVASDLGLSSKIVWHEGGSTTSRSFATENDSAAPHLPIIGHAVCRKNGPFDFVFIDALHYDFAVKADLDLAARWLAPGGIIAIHDVLGRWGSHVRRALMDFLPEHSEFMLAHPPYTSVEHGMGFLYKRKESSVQLPTIAAEPNQGLWQPPMVNAICAWVKGHLEDVKSIAYIGPDHHRLASKLAKQGNLVTTVGKSSVSGCVNLIWDEVGPLPPLPQVDLCICLHAGLSKFEDIEDLVSRMCGSAPRILLSTTPPGEQGAAHENCISFKQWLHLLAEHGYQGVDSPLQYLEPWLFNNPMALKNTYGLLTWFFEKTSMPIGEHIIDLCMRNASLTIDALASSVIINDTNVRLQKACSRELEWIEWKKQVDSRENEWMAWKKMVDERELQWIAWKKTIEESN